MMGLWVAAYLAVGAIAYALLVVMPPKSESKLEHLVLTAVFWPVIGVYGVFYGMFTLLWSSSDD